MSARALRFFLHCFLLSGFAMLAASFAGAQNTMVQPTPAMNALAAGPALNSSSADYIFQKRVDEVNLIFTVVDRHGKFVSDLKLADFDLLDDHRAPERVHAFQQESDLPLRVALVIDISGSVTNRFKYEQQAAMEFFSKILRPNLDKALVVAFNQKVHFEQDFTNDVAALHKAVSRLQPSGETALYDAVVFAANKLRDDSEKDTRRVIVLISDGDSNSGRAILDDAQQAALRAEASIYSLSTNVLESGDYTKGEAILELLSRYTGGELLSAHDKSDVVHAFRQVEKALRSQYVLSYKPADFQPDGHYRSVAVSARVHKLKVECRRGYYAPRD